MPKIIGTSTMKIQEIREDASDVELPRSNAALFVEFCHNNGHRRWAIVHLTYFHHQRKKFISSDIASIPCCEASDSNVFDQKIDRIHAQTFGDGQWIKTNREHQPPLSDIANPDRCQRHRVAAYEKLYSKKRPRTEDDSQLSFDDRHKRLRHLLHHLPSDYKSNQEDSNKTTEAEYCGKGKSIKVNGKSIEAKGESIKGTLTDLLKIGTTQQQEAVKESIAQVAGAIATTTFVHNILRGITILHDVEKVQKQIPFSRLVEYCDNRANDDGSRLEGLFQSLALAASQNSNDEVFDYNLVSGNARLFFQSVRDVPSNIPQNLRELLASVSMTDLKAARTKHRNMEIKREIRRHQIVNKITNDLHKTVGPVSLAIYAALAATGKKFTDLRKVREKDIPCFVSSAVKALKASTLRKVPSSVTVFHFPAVLSYLLGADYSMTCHALHLPSLAEEDPGIASRLCLLAEELKGLNPNAHDYDLRCVAIEYRATQIMRVRIADLPSRTPSVGPSAYNSSTAPVSTHSSSVSVLNPPDNRIPNPDLLVRNGLSSNGHRSMEMILGGGQGLEGLSELDNSCTFLEVADIGLYEQQEWWNFASADFVQVMDTNTHALPIGSS